MADIAIILDNTQGIQLPISLSGTMTFQEINEFLKEHFQVEAQHIFYLDNGFTRMFEMQQSLLGCGITHQQRIYFTQQEQQQFIRVSLYNTNDQFSVLEVNPHQTTIENIISASGYRLPPFYEIILIFNQNLGMQRVEQNQHQQTLAQFGVLTNCDFKIVPNVIQEHKVTPTFQTYERQPILPNQSEVLVQQQVQRQPNNNQGQQHFTLAKGNQQFIPIQPLQLDQQTSEIPLFTPVNRSQASSNVIATVFSHQAIEQEGGQVQKPRVAQPAAFQQKNPILVERNYTSFAPDLNSSIPIIQPNQAFYMNQMVTILDNGETIKLEDKTKYLQCTFQMKRSNKHDELTLKQKEIGTCTMYEGKTGPCLKIDQTTVSFDISGKGMLIWWKNKNKSKISIE